MSDKAEMESLENKPTIKEEEVALDYTDKEAAAVLQKIDLCLLPLLAITFGLQFLDKQALSYAAVIGLVADTHLVGSEYSLLTTIFYIGLLSFEYPVNLGLQRLPVAKFASVLVILWGAILAALAGAQDFSGLAAGRFFLGATEAVIGPALVLFTATWYRRREQPLRVGLWYCFQGLAITIGSLFAYWVQKWGGPLAPWRSLFLFYGLITVAWGFVLLLFLPDSISTARWLTDRQKAIAVDRLRYEKTTIGKKHWHWEQVRECLTDIRLLLLVLFCFAANWNPAINAFGALLIKGFGFSSLNTALLNGPAGLFNVGAILITTFLATKVKNMRCLLMAVCYLISLVGTVMLYTVDRSHKWTLLGGVWLSAIGPCGFTLSLSLAASNVSGQTKRSVTNASCFIAFALGNLVAPQLFLGDQAPAYPAGVLAITIANACAVVLAGLLALAYWKENRRRDALALTNELAQPQHDAGEAFLDVTDVQNLSFRYMV